MGNTTPEIGTTCYKVDDTVSYVNAGVTLILSILAVIGNSIIILVFALNKRVRTVNNRVVTLLAISDLLRGTVVMITKTIDHFVLYKSLSEPWCGITACTSAFTFFFNPMILAMIAIVRYFVIVPWSRRAKFLTRNRLNSILMFLFVISVLFALLPYFGVGKYEYSISHGVCFANWAPYNREYRTIFYIVVVGIAFPVLTVCYTRLFVLLKKHNDHMKSSRNEVFFDDNQVTLNQTFPRMKKDGCKEPSCDEDKNLEKPNLLRESCSVDRLEISTDTCTINTVPAAELVQEDSIEMVERRSRLYTNRSFINVNFHIGSTKENVDFSSGSTSGIRDLDSNSEEDNRKVSVTLETETTVNVIVNNKQTNHKKKRSKGFSGRRVLSKKEYQMTKSMIFIFVAYIICWFPAAVVNIIALNKRCDVPAAWKLIIVTMVELKSVLNPILYGYGNRDYRVICRNYIKRIFFQ